MLTFRSKIISHAQIYLGGSNLSEENGYPIYAGQTYFKRMNVSDLYMIGNDGAARTSRDVRVIIDEVSPASSDPNNAPEQVKSDTPLIFCIRHTVNLLSNESSHRQIGKTTAAVNLARRIKDTKPLSKPVVLMSTNAQAQAASQQFKDVKFESPGISSTGRTGTFILDQDTALSMLQDLLTEIGQSKANI